jgi:hypothetical protein
MQFFKQTWTDLVPCLLVENGTMKLLTRGRQKFWKIMRITFHQTEKGNDTKQGTKRLMSYVGLGSRMLCSAG